MSTQVSRLHDPGWWLDRSTGRSLVVHPRCEHRAVVPPRPALRYHTELSDRADARLREHGGTGPKWSMFARLPRWMRSPVNRRKSWSNCGGSRPRRSGRHR